MTKVGPEPDDRHFRFLTSGKGGPPRRILYKIFIRRPAILYFPNEQDATFEVILQEWSTYQSGAYQYQSNSYSA